MIARSSPVPQTPPLETRVAENYQRFDGLDSTPYPGSNLSGLETPYDVTPRPGQAGTPGSLVDVGPGKLGPNARGIPGVVGSVGATPLPVADCLKKTNFETVAATQSNPNFRFGPGGQYQGIAQTIAMSEISQNPPQPGDLASIYAGLA
jgi:hypothetical protein